jgi:hypothetical protein
MAATIALWISEFASALHTVLIEDAITEFGARFQWASIAGPQPESLGGVSIPAAAAPRIATVADRLRKVPTEPSVEVLTGPIVAVARDVEARSIIPLLMPVSEPPEIDPGLVDAAPPEPVERRVMRTFAEALTRMHDLVVTPEREPRPEDTLGLMFAGVSAG